MGEAPPKGGSDTPGLLTLAGWLALAIICVVVYLPGLSGPFVLDDFGTISGLGDRGGIVDWETFKAFVFSGHSGPTGRPVALLSFLVDATNWPAEALPFKRTNLVIHLINGALLGLIISRLLAVLGYESRRTRAIAIVAVALWLLHPFLVSTTLYAVQRMALLSTLFVFAGLATYLYGRSLLERSPRRAYVIMSVSIGLFTLLATYSKENGALLPLLIGVVELTVFASRGSRFPALNRYWAGLFLLLPSIGLGLLLGAQFFKADFFETVPPRDFSLYERVLTQPRVLLDYLQHWFIPQLYTTGVFQDHFIKSEGLLSPVSTLLSLLLHVALIALAFARRRQWPLFSLAVLFFYAGHALESTTLNLELYFEHRNYLSAALLFLPLVAWLEQKLMARGFVIVAVFLAALLGGFTHYSATIWGNFSSMVEASARKAPTSARAQAQYAVELFNVQRYDDSLAVIDRAIAEIPGEQPHLLLNRLIILCNLNLLDRDEYERVAATLTPIAYDARLLNVFIAFASGINEGRCPKVAIGDLRPMIVDMLERPENQEPRNLEYSHLRYLLGYIEASTGDAAAAVAAFEESLRAHPGATQAMMMAALMASSGYPEESLGLSLIALDQLEADRQSTLSYRRVGEADIRAFQQQVRAELDARGDDSARPDP